MGEGTLHGTVRRALERMNGEAEEPNTNRIGRGSSRASGCGGGVRFIDSDFAYPRW
jgi:hypothetical protein